MYFQIKMPDLTIEAINPLFEDMRTGLLGLNVARAGEKIVFGQHYDEFQKIAGELGVKPDFCGNLACPISDSAIKVLLLGQAVERNKRRGRGKKVRPTSQESEQAQITKRYIQALVGEEIRVFDDSDALMAYVNSLTK